MGRRPGKATGAGKEGLSRTGPSAGSGESNDPDPGAGDGKGGLTLGLKGETSEGLPGTTIRAGGNGSTAESIGKGIERGTKGSDSSPSTGLPGPQIEQVSAQALPSDFSAFLGPAAGQEARVALRRPGDRLVNHGKARAHSWKGLRGLLTHQAAVVVQQGPGQGFRRLRVALPVELAQGPRSSRAVPSSPNTTPTA